MTTELPIVTDGEAYAFAYEDYKSGVETGEYEDTHLDIVVAESDWRGLFERIEALEKENEDLKAKDHRI